MSLISMYLLHFSDYNSYNSTSHINSISSEPDTRDKSAILLLPQEDKWINRTAGTDLELELEARSEPALSRI